MCAAIVCALAASPASADYKAEYRAYNLAFAAGDIAKALEHGEAAWRQAEVEIGEKTTTAILAYNYATLVSFSDPVKATEAFDRAIAIAQIDGNSGAIPLKEAMLRRAEARVRADRDNAVIEAELDALLTASDPADLATIEAQALGWRTLALSHIRSEKFNRAKGAADKGVALASRLSPPSTPLLREILFLAGLARAAGSKRTETDVYEAVALFDQSALLFPRQKDIDHFDRFFAATIAWRYSVGALAKSYGSTPSIKIGSLLPTGEDVKSAYERATARGGFEEQAFLETPLPLSCNSPEIWSERKLPAYPRSAERNSRIGAILIGYDVDGAGVSRTVILADFAEAGFGAAAVESMKKWRLKPGLDPACWKNRITIFSFVIE